MRALGLVFVLAPVTAQAADLLGPPKPPAEPQIFQGAEVEPCAWPTTVAVTGGNALCTGTLIHPQVVVYAAHCGGGNKSIQFGEATSGSGFEIPAQCMSNPEWQGSQGNDFSFCVLDEPAELPITPVVFGCETEILSPGREMALVGFGNNTDDGGAGTKRWGMSTIGGVNEQTVTAFANPASICSGDSGGPAFVEFPDGSWHAFGIASTVTGGCGGAGTWGLIHNAVPWIEDETGIDVTPCHQVDGTWDPTPQCQMFYSGGSSGSGEWANWCEGTPVSEASNTCGSAFNSEPDDVAPTVTIVAPMDLASFEPGEFDGIIDLDAADEGWGVREVRIEVNGEEQPVTDALPPYHFENADFPLGTWELVGVAEDWAGNITKSEPVYIGIGEVPVAPTPETTGVDESGGGVGTEDGTSSGGAADGSGSSDSTGDLGQDDGDGGCACRSGGSTGHRGGLAYAPWLLCGLVAVRRRRRQVP